MYLKQRKNIHNISKNPNVNSMFLKPNESTQVIDATDKLKPKSTKLRK